MKQIAVVVSVIVVACAGATAAGEKSAATSAPATLKVVPPPRISAFEGFRLAARQVYKWDHGATLIQVTARPSDFPVDGRSSKWGYRFVSATGEQIASFAVDMRHPASPVRITRNVGRPAGCTQSVNVAFWKIDSPTVWLMAKQCGLPQWLAKHPAFQLSSSGNKLELSSNKADGPHWSLVLSAQVQAGSKKRDHFSLQLSAANGRVLSRSQ